VIDKWSDLFNLNVNEELMSFDHAGWLKLADWHLREAFLCVAARNEEHADHHRQSAREYLALVSKASVRGVSTIDDLSAVCIRLKDETPEVQCHLI
jgi:hypothetical protein